MINECLFTWEAEVLNWPGTNLSEEGVDRQCGMLFLVHCSSEHMVLPIIVYFLSYVWLFWHPVDCSPPGSSVHNIFQARRLECIAISFSRESSWNRDWTHISCIGRGILYHWAIREGCVLYLKYIHTLFFNKWCWPLCSCKMTMEIPLENKSFRR